MIAPIYKISLHPARRGLGPISSPSPECVRHLESHGSDGVSPLLVQAADVEGEYLLLTGEKWWVAAQAARVEKLPIQVFTGNGEAALSLIRADFAQDANPIQLARLADQMMKGEGGAPLNQTEVAAILRMNRSSLAHHLRLLSLVPEIQSRIEDGTLTLGKVKPLVGLAPAVQRKVAQRISGGGWTARKVEELATVFRDPHLAQKMAQKKAQRDNPDNARLEKLISEGVGVPATVEWEGGRGSLRLDFDDLDVLSGILDRLGVSVD